MNTNININEKISSNKIYCDKKSNSEYIRWILEILGPVILGSKPSEIINIPSSSNCRDNKLNDIQYFFSKCSRISYEIINTYDGGTRVLFINKTSLSNVLCNKKCLNFLKFIGYPSNYELQGYISTLIKKLHYKDFPHEIGIFLGYPLKDVVGFMGYGNYKYYKTKYWKIYGDPSISYDVCNNFLRDREKMKNLLHLNDLDDLKNVM